MIQEKFPSVCYNKIPLEENGNRKIILQCFIDTCYITLSTIMLTTWCIKKTKPDLFIRWENKNIINTMVMCPIIKNNFCKSSCPGFWIVVFKPSIAPQTLIQCEYLSTPFASKDDSSVNQVSTVVMTGLKLGGSSKLVLILD